MASEIQAAGQAVEAYDPGPTIMHHILDSNEWELPWGTTIPLPHIELFGIDLSITKHVVMMWIVCAILLVVLGLARRRKNDLVPSGVRNALEVLIVFIRDDVARRAIPDHADRYVPFLLTTFFFILTCNLAGLVPGMTTSTGNISVTAALALIAFVTIQMGGIRQYGVVGHVKNLLPHGLPVWLIPLIFAIEVLSQFVRPFALCIRLFANMMAGHVVILAFISLIFILGILASPVAVAFTLFVHFLELLVAFLQAYIFTMFTAQFIGLSVHPAH